MLNLLKLQSLVAKCCKCKKTAAQNFTNFTLLYFARKKTFEPNLVKLAYAIQKYTKLATFSRLHFLHFTILCNQTLPFCRTNVLL